MFDFLFTKAHAYQPLTDIGDFSQKIVEGAGKGLPTDLNQLINFAFYVLIAVAVVLAIFGVIRGGYVYLASGDSGSNKSRAKRILQASVGGLLLALGGWLILNTINPDILVFQPDYNELNRPNTVSFKDTTTIESRNQINNLLSNGFQGTDSNAIARDTNLLAFFGEKTNEELTTILKNQTDNLEGGAQEYREFISNLYNTKLSYENDYYIDTRTQRKVYRDHSFEINAINSMLNKFESINSNLSQEHQEILDEEWARYQNNKASTQGDGIKLNY